MPNSKGIYIALTNRGIRYPEYRISRQPMFLPNETEATPSIIHRRLEAGRGETIRLELGFSKAFNLFSATAVHIRVVVACRKDFAVYDEILLKPDIRKATTCEDGPFLMNRYIVLPQPVTVTTDEDMDLVGPWEEGWEDKVGYMAVFVERGRAVEKSVKQHRNKNGGREGNDPFRYDIGGGWRRLQGENGKVVVFGFQVREAGTAAKVTLQKMMELPVVVDADDVDEDARKAGKAARKAARKVARQRKEDAKKSGPSCETTKTSSGVLAGCPQDCDDEEGPPQKPAAPQPSVKTTKTAPTVTQPAVTKTVEQKTPLLDQVLQADRSGPAGAEKIAQQKITIPTNDWHGEYISMYDSDDVSVFEDDLPYMGQRKTLAPKRHPRAPEVIELDNDDTSDEEQLFVSERNVVAKQRPLPLPVMLQSNAANTLASEKVEPPKQLVGSTIPGTVAYLQSPKSASQDTVRETASSGEGKDIAVKSKGIVLDGQALVAEKPDTTVLAEKTSLMAATTPFAGFGGSNNPILVQSTWPNVQITTTTAKDNAVDQLRPAIPAKLASTPQLQQQPTDLVELSTTTRAQPFKSASKDPSTATTPTKEPAKVAEPKQKAEVRTPTPDTNALKRKAAVMDEAADLEDELRDEMEEIELEKRAIEVRRRLRELARRKRELGMQ
ncbi:hypothetical protein LTR10_000170 [Elasticomyces elasticus]|nr:hypothetical protein LTR10_000170 [Elasticomyces elasticus]KAK4980571.1 hypothetical protein LTR42_000879 [Elasticomyces elasticus]